MKNFWQTLPKPFFVLAPLEDVTDAAFRRLIAQCGKPHVMFTEFTSADGLILANEKGKEQLLRKFLYSKEEKPIVAQIFSSVPAHIEEVTRMIVELGFDGVDINMGCPDRAVEKSGCGAALINTPELAMELIAAAKRGAAGSIPVSVKTRLGYNEDELETWLPELLKAEPDVITLHARTRKEMSDVPARWDRIARAVAIRDSLGSKTLIVGNGDASDIADARAKAVSSGADGVMLGRAIFGNPWLFSGRSNQSQEERMRALAQHIELFEELLGGYKSFAVMKKHFKSYISGWNGAKELRSALMETTNAKEAVALLHTK